MIKTVNKSPFRTNYDPRPNKDFIFTQPSLTDASQYEPLQRTVSRMLRGEKVTQNINMVYDTNLSIQELDGVDTADIINEAHTVIGLQQMAINEALAKEQQLNKVEPIKQAVESTAKAESELKP